MRDKAERSTREILEGNELFSHLPAEDIRSIERYSVIRRCRDGDIVFAEGDPGRSLYIVDTGEVVVRKTSEDGLTTDIARYVEGNFFGELDLFNTTERTATAVAGGETRLLEFPGEKTEFEEFIKQEPSVAARLFHRMLVETAGRIRRVNALVKENSPLVQELRKQVYRDKLTGLYNHIYLAERLRELMEKDDAAFALCITKPDNFKELNDTYGHEAGDLAIRILGRSLRDFIGADERTARYKGNAMAVVLPGAGREEALEQARGIRDFLNGLDLSAATGNSEFQVTASVGVCLYPGFEGSVEEMLFTTHELPLEGRSRGGNTILLACETGEGTG